MKLTRYKKLRRHLSFFCNNFNFHKPYQVLIDGTFCCSALNYKCNIKDQLPKYFDAEVKFLTTQCVILETERLGSKVYGSLVVLKQFGIHQCGHKSPVTGSECLLSMLGENNSSRYFIATQDRDLQTHARKIPGTPILYLHQMTPTLEAPSKETQEKINSSKISPLSKLDSEIIQHNKEKLGIKIQEKIIFKKKKGKKQPNPLSCKKKKNKPIPKVEPEGKIKRKRKRIKISKHLKEALKNND